MRRSLPPFLALLTLAAPLAGQAKPGHVYTVGYYQALPGKGDAYNKAVAEVTIPVFDELVKRKAIVSYLPLSQVTGAGEYTHLFILEFPDWATFGAFPARVNDAAQAVLHKSWSEAIAGSAAQEAPALTEFRPPAACRPTRA